MKHILSAVILLTGVTLFPLTANSQEQQGCFLLDSNGRRIDLGSLCSESNSTSGIFQAPIKRRESGIPVIDVKFNGSHTFEMLVDTGASATVLTPTMAQTLGVKEEGIVLVETAGGIVKSTKGRVSSIQAGGAVANNLVVLIAPSLSLGLLGQNFFGNYDVTIKENAIEFRSR